METLFEKKIDKTLYKVYEGEHPILPRGFSIFGVQEHVKCKSDKNWAESGEIYWHADGLDAEDALEWYLEHAFEGEDI